MGIARKQTVKFLILAAALAALWILGRYFQIDPVKAESFLSRFPLIYSGIIFVCLYVVITFFFWFSKDIFRLVSACLFGVYLSTLLVFIAEAINAAVLFSLSRILGRQFIEERLGTSAAGLDKRIANTGFLWLFLFRAVPLIPFRFLDIAAGLTDISFKRYMAAVCLGSPLRIFWVQYVLAGAGRAALSNSYAMADYLSLDKPAFIFTLVYLILVVFVVIKLKKDSHASKN
jgi:uncharacterized membrane protein YdjX (TVP38/TMEM64 family)